MSDEDNSSKSVSYIITYNRYFSV